MFTTSAFFHFVDGLRAIQRSRRNETLMRSLPDEIQKDIGWPDYLSSSDNRTRPFWNGRSFR